MTYTILENKSEEEWLEQRRQVIGASDIGKIASGSEAAFRSLYFEKLNPPRKFSNKYIDWGNKREPMIADKIREDIAPHLVHNDRLLISDDCTTFGATPDMLTTEAYPQEGIASAELKTIKGDYLAADEVFKHRPQYRDQVQWQMLVQGSEACLFAWEAYSEDENGYLKPGELRCEVIPRDEKRQEQLIATAFAYCDYEPPNEVDGDDDDFEVIAAVDGVIQLQDELTELNARVKDKKAELEDARGELRGLMGDDPVLKSYEGGRISVEITKPKMSSKFDRKGLKSEYPDLEKQFTIQTEAPGDLKVKVNND